MRKYIALLSVLIAPFGAVADTVDGGDNEVLQELYGIYATVQQFCGGISDRISNVSGVAKVNTAVTAAGTVASGGALVTGIMKSKVDKEIEELQKQICKRGGCDPDKVAAMSDEEFLDIVAKPFVRQLELDRELKRLQQEKNAATAKSKKLGNWRTGLMAGGTATNIASAIIAGLNRKQSDLIQQVTACNTAVDKLRVARSAAINNGLNPIENPVLNEFNTTIQSCGSLKVADIEKIEKRMTVVMGTSIGGAVIGAVGTGTSAAANTDKIRNDNSDAGKEKEKALNTTANVSAGLATATGAVGTGFNISLITLTKKLMKSAEQCENTL